MNIRFYVCLTRLLCTYTPVLLIDVVLLMKAAVGCQNNSFLASEFHNPTYMSTLPSLYEIITVNAKWDIGKVKTKGDKTEMDYAHGVVGWATRTTL